MKFKPALQQSTYKKLAVYGGPGSGKSILSLSAPGKKLVIDSESGTLPYASLTSFEVINTQSFGEIKDTVDEIAANPPSEETTLIIDSASIIWSGLQQACLEKKMQEKGLRAVDGTEKVTFTLADWGTLKRWHKDILSSLMSLKCHVVCTFRENEVMDSKTFEKTGVFVPEWEKNSPYTFDFVGRVNRRKLTFTKGRMAKDGKLIDLIGKSIDLPTIVNGSDLPSIWTSIFGEQEKPVAAHAEATPSNDTASLEKDPEVLRLSKDIRSRLLPKRQISSEDIEAYLKSKTNSYGERLAIEGKDGKIHLSEMAIKNIKWLHGILEDDAKSMQLIGKIKEVKK